MNDTLKPTPVSVTTPTTMPTTAAAAPTASAYFAPVTKPSTRSGRVRRLAGLRKPMTMQPVMPQNAAR
jgi:hypothetical protein